MMQAMQKVWQYSSRDLIVEQLDELKAFLDSFQNIFMNRDKDC